MLSFLYTVPFFIKSNQCRFNPICFNDNKYTDPPPPKPSPFIKIKIVINMFIYDTRGFLALQLLLAEPPGVSSIRKTRAKIL